MSPFWWNYITGCTGSCQNDKLWWRQWWKFCQTWWCHEMETFSVSLALCEGNPPVTGGFPSQRLVTRSLIFSWANKRDAGDLWRHRSHYEVTVVYFRAIVFRIPIIRPRCIRILDSDQNRAVMDFSGLLWARTRRCVHWNHWFRCTMNALTLWRTEQSIWCIECLTITCLPCRWNSSPTLLHPDMDLTKWPPFSRRHFQTHFLEWKCMNFA